MRLGAWTGRVGSAQSVLSLKQAIATAIAAPAIHGTSPDQIASDAASADCSYWREAMSARAVTDGASEASGGCITGRGEQVASRPGEIDLPAMSRLRE